MTEGAACGEVDQDGDDERDASDSKGKVITVCLFETERLLGVVHNFDGSSGSKECTDVDGHIEERESRVALACHFGRSVEITDHHLEVAFEKACADADECKCTNHGTNGSTTIAEGYSQKHVTKEHDADADFHHFAISKFVGKDAANKWQEVNEHQEC